MNRTKILLFTALVLAGVSSCKKELDVQNPNQPTPASASTETGILSLAMGGVYASGFRELKYSDGVPGFFWTGAVGAHELMGDALGEEAANQFGNQFSCPDYVIFDDNTKLLNPSAPNTQIALMRAVNNNALAGQNPTYYEWAYMYNMNGVLNNVLELVENVPFTGDAAVKKNTVKAWCYFWKGFAYSRIGSMYYAGLINDKFAETNGIYVTKEKIIEEAAKNLDQAVALLTPLSGNATFKATLESIIPKFMQVKGTLSEAPTADEWKRTINTLKARNILVNTTTKAMTAAQWGQILTLTTDGVKVADKVFTARSNTNADVISTDVGSLAAKSTGEPGAVTYKISERLIQDFPVGDKRLDNNLARTTPWIGDPSRGIVFNTRYRLLNGGAGLAGVVVLSNRAVGAYELLLSSTFEENELMKAEAKLYTGDIAGALASIDAVRKFQGAGLPVLAGLALYAAKEELRKERRVGLFLRGLSFYDARRWGVIDDISKGGGRTNAVVVDKAGKVNTKATINYNYLDYWDVPDNELAYNPPASGSAPTKNPK